MTCIPVERCFTEDVFLHQTLGSRKLYDLLHHLKLPIVAGSVETQLLHLHLGDFGVFSLLSKATYNHSCTHSHNDGGVYHTGRQPGAVRVRRRLAQGHLHTRGGARDRTSNLPVTSQPGLPPELLPPCSYYHHSTHPARIIPHSSASLTDSVCVR